jgi:uncharacterized BrkB/YihY/UPF0761 family membrane protein
MAVVNKYADDRSGYLAARIAYYAFLSLFPLLLLLTTVLGVVLVDDPGLQQQVLNSALSQFPVIGDQLGQRGHLSGSAAGVVIGIAFAPFGALGGGQAVQSAMDIVWVVPRTIRPNPIWSGSGPSPV